jgi:hypothetical protein
MLNSLKLLLRSRDKQFTLVDTIGFLLFIVLIAELAIGGGGRLVAFGDITLRMVLFALALVITVIHLLSGKTIPADYRNLLIAFFIVIGLALTVGISNHAERTYWWEDLKPLLYFLILPFFYFSIKGISEIQWVANIIIGSALLQAIVFFFS